MMIDAQAAVAGVMVGFSLGLFAADSTANFRAALKEKFSTWGRQSAQWLVKQCRK